MTEEMAKRLIREADEFPVALADGSTRIVTIDEIHAEVDADLAVDDGAPADIEEVRHFLLLDLEDGELTLRPDGRWQSGPGGRIGTILRWGE